MVGGNILYIVVQHQLIKIICYVCIIDAVAGRCVHMLRFNPSAKWYMVTLFALAHIVLRYPRIHKKPPFRLLR